MKKDKVVIFDFDGVIVDSLMAAYDTWKEAGATITVDEYRERFNGNINHAYAPADIDFHEEYKRKVEHLKIFPGIAEAVKELESQHHLVVVSSTLNDFINQVLTNNGLHDHFEDILGNDVSTSKVEKFKMVFEKYGVTASDCVIITDTLGDMKEAVEVDMPSIGVSWGFQKPEVLREGSAVFIVNEPKDIVGAVQKLFEGADKNK